MREETPNRGDYMRLKKRFTCSPPESRGGSGGCWGASAPFIRYTLLVPGWTTLCLQNCLNSLWHRFNKVLKTFLRDFGPYWLIASCSYCRFIVCTSMMRISRSTTSQRCSIGLRSSDCGGHLSKVNSLSCSRNQSERIWALWHGAISCWK